MGYFSVDAHLGGLIGSGAAWRSNRRLNRRLNRSRSGAYLRHHPNTSGAVRHQRGIEKLAEALEKMARVRPPPRQVYELPSFSDAAREWLPFQAAYNESSKAYSFTPNDNMARLRSCLRGPAREVVESLLHTAANPEAVMQTQRQCYGRPEVLASKALDDLKKLPRLGSTTTEINTFAVKLQTIVTVLGSIEQQGYLASPLLARNVMEKLSQHLRARFGDYAAEQITTMEPQIMVLSRFLMREVDRALRYAYTSGGTKSAAAAAVRREVARPTPAKPAKPIQRPI
ncbi:uncharacterized protein [Choristoneura fumiferana]|uniref:uncharacterized protein n=1 Tax=Choristoneura fumiferana TaxID=7141 RepID=UPI003D154491